MSNELPYSKLSRRDGLFALAGTAAAAMTAARPVDSGMGMASAYSEHAVSLAEFGYAGDGNRDDTHAWRDAIAAAYSRNIRRITVPWGVNGVSRVNHPICDGALPSGLTFEGEGRRHANPDQTGQRLLYTGNGVCWSISSPPDSPATIGQWTWRHLMFEATNPTATMFAFNAGEEGLVRDGAGASYIVFVLFESCYLKGAGGGARQTGDAIRATKTFSLRLDSQCQVRDWRRGVWLRGCDDCTIEGRIWLNTRSIVHERSGTFGSNLQVRSNWLGRCPDQNAEPAYILWDDGSGTAIFGTFFEGHDHGGIRQNERALVRLNGFGTTLAGCRFAEGRCLEIGPLAREVTLVSPGFASHLSQNNAIISPAYSSDFGFQQDDFRILIVGASKNAVKHLGSHPRLVYRGRLPMGADTVGGEVPVDMECNLLADENGYRPRRRLLTAFTLFAKNADTLVNGGAKIVKDRRSSQGWLIACSAEKPQAGLQCTFAVGRDVQVGDHLRFAVRAACQADGWSLRLLRGNCMMEEGALELGGENSFRYATSTVSLNGWTAGERLSLAILKTRQPKDDLLIDFVEISVLSAETAVAPPPARLPDVNADALSPASVNAAMSALTARLDALEAALRRSRDLP